MLPGDTVYRLLQVLDSSGSPVSGLSLSDFTVTAYGRAYGASASTTYSPGTTLAEIGSTGIYDLSYLLPPSAGFQYFRISPNSSSNRIAGPNIWTGEVESVDLATINANVVVPVATVTASAQLGMALAIECIVYRLRQLNVTVKDQAGNPVDLTQYNNFRISIRSKDQQTTKWDAWAGTPYGVAITGDSSGNLQITFPESSSGPIYIPWAASVKRSIGDFVVPATPNGFIYRCTIAGTSAGSAPTWPTSIGGTIADGTATWTCIAEPIWQASAAALVGQYMRPRTGAPAILGQYWLCTTPGTTGASEPAWPSSPTAGQTITDNTATWTYQSDYFAALTSAGAQGVNQFNLYWELVADELATDKTVPVIQSSILTLSRREVGT